MVKNKIIKIPAILLLSVCLFLLLITFSGCGVATFEEGLEPEVVTEEEVAEAAAPETVSSEEEVKIGVILISEESQFEVTLREDILQQVDRFGSEVSFCFNEGEPSQNIECSQGLLQQDIHVLIVDSPDMESFETVLDEARSHGVYVINTGTLKNISRAPLLVQYIGSDNTEGGYRIGVETGRMISRELQWEDAEVLVIDVPELAYEGRASFFISGAEQQASDININRVEVTGTTEEIRDEIISLLEEYPDTRVIHAVSEESAQAALEAAEMQGKTTDNFVITSFGATEDIYNSINEDGLVKAAVILNTEQLAERLVRASVELAMSVDESVLERYQAQPSWIQTVVVNNRNVAEYLN